MHLVCVSGQEGTFDVTGMSFKEATDVFGAAGRPITLMVAWQQQQLQTRAGTIYTANNPEVGCVDFRNSPTPAGLSGEQTPHGAIHTSLQESPPAAGVSRPASPARVQGPQSQKHSSAEHLSLAEALTGARLMKYEDALRELGCEIIQDLADLEEQDMMEIGMKKIEITRLRRLVPQLKIQLPLGGSE